jgi:hypothetical protein
MLHEGTSLHSLCFKGCRPPIPGPSGEYSPRRHSFLILLVRIVSDLDLPRQLYLPFRPRQALPVKVREGQGDLVLGIENPSDQPRLQEEVAEPLPEVQSPKSPAYLISKVSRPVRDVTWEEEAVAARKAKTKTHRALAYLRVSTLSQADHGVSLEAQEA